MDFSTVALVTTCLNEKNSIKDWITDVISQTYQPNEICIVDAGSTDGTIETLEEWALLDSRVNLKVWPNCNVAQGRNHAISFAKSKIIVSTDIGCRLDHEWLERLSTPLLSTDSIQVVAGNYCEEVPENPTIFFRAASYINNRNQPKLEPGFLPSSRSIAYRKHLWAELGGYPEDLTLAGDDTVFAIQIANGGYEMAFAKSAICYWGRPSTFQGYLREAFVYSRGNGEAGILSPRFANASKFRYSFVLAHLDAIKSATFGSLRPLARALSRLDLTSAFIIPYMKYHITLKRYCGYVEGVKKGIVDCLDSRVRVNYKNKLLKNCEAFCLEDSHE